jgi:hypothetical protein
MRYIIAVSHRLSSKYLTLAPLSRGGVARAETLAAAAPPSLSIVLLVVAGGHPWSKPACQQRGRGGILSPAGSPWSWRCVTPDDMVLAVKVGNPGDGPRSW